MRFQKSLTKKKEKTVEIIKLFNISKCNLSAVMHISMPMIPYCMPSCTTANQGYSRKWDSYTELVSPLTIERQLYRSLCNLYGILEIS